MYLQLSTNTVDFWDRTQTANSNGFNSSIRPTGPEFESHWSSISINLIFFGPMSISLALLLGREHGFEATAPNVLALNPNSLSSLTVLTLSNIENNCL